MVTFSAHVICAMNMKSIRYICMLSIGITFSSASWANNTDFLTAKSPNTATVILDKWVHGFSGKRSPKEIPVGKWSSPALSRRSAQLEQIVGTPHVLRFISYLSGSARVVSSAIRSAVASFLNIPSGAVIVECAADSPVIGTDGSVVSRWTASVEIYVPPATMAGISLTEQAISDPSSALAESVGSSGHSQSVSVHSPSNALPLDIILGVSIPVGLLCIVGLVVMAKLFGRQNVSTAMPVQKQKAAVSLLSKQGSTGYPSIWDMERRRRGLLPLAPASIDADEITSSAQRRVSTRLGGGGSVPLPQSPTESERSVGAVFGHEPSEGTADGHKGQRVSGDNEEAGPPEVAPHLLSRASIRDSYPHDCAKIVILPLLGLPGDPVKLKPVLHRAGRKGYPAGPPRRPVTPSSCSAWLSSQVSESLSAIKSPPLFEKSRFEVKRSVLHWNPAPDDKQSDSLQVPSLPLPQDYSKLMSFYAKNQQERALLSPYISSNISVPPVSSHFRSLSKQRSARNSIASTPTSGVCTTFPPHDGTRAVTFAAALTGSPSSRRTHSKSSEQLKSAVVRFPDVAVQEDETTLRCDSRRSSLVSPDSPRRGSDRIKVSMASSIDNFSKPSGISAISLPATASPCQNGALTSAWSVDFPLSQMSGSLDRKGSVASSINAESNISSSSSAHDSLPLEIVVGSAVPRFTSQN